MIIKTQSLTARALDWAVAKAIGANPELLIEKRPGAVWQVFVDYDHRTGKQETFNPTTNWGQLGPIIESMAVSLVPLGGEMWGAAVDDYFIEFEPPEVEAIGDKAAEAACRAIVAARLGDQVDVPEVLCQ